MGATKFTGEIVEIVKKYLKLDKNVLLKDIKINLSLNNLPEITLTACLVNTKEKED